MSGIVAQVINRKEDTRTGKASLTLLDTDFIGSALLVGDDNNFPQPPNISNLDYLETGTILSEQMLDNIRQVQVYQYDDPTTDFDIKYAIEQTNIEVVRYGSRVTESPFNFISDINASWYPILNPDSHNAGSSADYDILKEYAENAKKLYGFFIEHSDYCLRVREQLAEWSKGRRYRSVVNSYRVFFTNYPLLIVKTVLQNDYGYTYNLGQSGGVWYLDIQSLGNTPNGITGNLNLEFEIQSSGQSSTFDVFTQITDSDIDNDGIITCVSTSPEITSQNFIYNTNEADHFYIPVGVITLSYLQTRVFP